MITIKKQTFKELGLESRHLNMTVIILASIQNTSQKKKKNWASFDAFGHIKLPLTM